jgi:hypothetical protein
MIMVATKTSWLNWTDLITYSLDRTLRGLRESQPEKSNMLKPKNILTSPSRCSQGQQATIRAGTDYNCITLNQATLNGSQMVIPSLEMANYPNPSQ